MNYQKQIVVLADLDQQIVNKGLTLGKHKEYNREEKDGETGRLKKHIRHLENEITKLKSQLRSYEKALSKNIMFLKERTVDLSLEDLIIGANAELNLQQIKKASFDNFDTMKKKWCCYKCEVGIMKFITIPRGETTHYLRKCSNPKCDNRTELKELVDGVDKGII